MLMCFLLLQYAVVEHSNGGLVPVATRWLSGKEWEDGDTTELLYPPKNTVNVTRLVIGLQKPRTDWVKSNVTFQHSYSEYS